MAVSHNALHRVFFPVHIMNYTTLYGKVKRFLTYFRLELWDRKNFSTLAWKSFPQKLLVNGVFDFSRLVIFHDNYARARKSGIIFGKIFCGFERGNAGMKLTVGFEIDFDSVHCMYLLDLLYLYDTIYILYCQHPIGTFLTYVRLEKNLSGTKFPARSFRTLVYESETPARGRAKKFPAQLQLQLPAQLPAGGRRVGGLWVHNVYTMGAPCTLTPKFLLYLAKSLYFRALNRYTFTM